MNRLIAPRIGGMDQLRTLIQRFSNLLDVAAPNDFRDRRAFRDDVVRVLELRFEQSGQFTVSAIARDGERRIVAQFVSRVGAFLEQKLDDLAPVLAHREVQWLAVLKFAARKVRIFRNQRFDGLQVTVPGRAKHGPDVGPARPRPW